MALKSKKKKKERKEGREGEREREKKERKKERKKEKRKEGKKEGRKEERKLTIIIVEASKCKVSRVCWQARNPRKSFSLHLKAGC